GGLVAQADGERRTGRGRMAELPIDLRERAAGAHDLAAFADDDRVGVGPQLAHVEALRRGNAKAFALADGEVVQALVCTERVTGVVDDGAGAVNIRMIFFDQRSGAGGGDEAEVRG